MKKFLIAAASIMAFAAPAVAADMRMPVKAAPPIPVATTNWNGFYVGVDGGYSWGRSRNDAAFSLGGVPFIPPAGSVLSGTFNLNGGLAGGQVGYNWQFGSWLLGFEGDGQWAHERGSATFTCLGNAIQGPNLAVIPGPCGIAGVTGTMTQTIEAFGTVRGRLGWVVVPEVLLYGTGGLAVGSIKTDLALATTGGATIAAGTTHITRAGWTAGGGVEWMFTRGWSAKLEYLFMDLGRVNNALIVTPPGFAISVNSKVTDNIFRGGINYHF